MKKRNEKSIQFFFFFLCAKHCELLESRKKWMNIEYSITKVPLLSVFKHAVYPKYNWILIYCCHCPIKKLSYSNSNSFSIESNYNFILFVFLFIMSGNKKMAHNWKKKDGEWNKKYEKYIFYEMFFSPYFYVNRISIKYSHSTKYLSSARIIWNESNEYIYF